MLFSRWQAPVIPSPEQFKMIFQAEGLIPKTEVCPKGSAVNDHRHPFDEIRVVLSGQMFMKISGNQLLLRPGDRIEIPSNTKHSMQVEGTEDCVCLTAQRIF